MSCYASTVVNFAKSEVGYLEKNHNNKTKYAEYMDKLSNFYYGKKNGFDWCSVFVDYCFVKKFGETNAKKLLCYPSKNSYGASCTWSAKYFKNNKQFYSSPKVGDKIFFKRGLGIGHTGIVVKVTTNKVYTVEGNTYSGKLEGVFEHEYSINDKSIAGYGRPKYDEEPKTNTYSIKVGDKVVLQKDATIYGKTSLFSPFVYNCTLYVRQINGNRVVISTLPSGDVTGAVDIKYIRKI